MSKVDEIMKQIAILIDVEKDYDKYNEFHAMYDKLRAMIEQYRAEAISVAISQALYGTYLDSCGNRDDDGLLATIGRIESVGAIGRYDKKALSTQVRVLEELLSAAPKQEEV